MMKANYSIRSMTRPELDLCIQLAAAEGWNPGLHDADAFYAADPNGFLVGLLDGQPIGCISAVRYGEHFGFIGFYIVVPDYRRQQFGLKLWQAAMQRLNGCLVGLDGVVAQQANYRKSGFELAYNNIRFQGSAQPGNSCDAAIVELAAVPEPMLMAYDRELFPASRAAFLARWISRPGTAAKAFVQNGMLRGYGVIRPCRTGYKIGPLFAENAQTAHAIYEALVNQVERGAQVQLDIPQVNIQAVRMAETWAMTPVFETARMYTGPAPSIDLQRIFGVTSFELG